MDKESSDPPPYTEVPHGVSPQDDQAPPSYEDEEPRNIASTATPYRPFPTVMNGFYRMMGIKSFNLCGATRDDPLFVVEVHTGFSRKAPLGSQPGLLLRNGTNAKDPIIAAAGDESQWAQRSYAFNTTTVVRLPSLEARDGLREMATEMMKLSLTGDEVVTFGFSIEVGEKLIRKRFEWRKVKKDDDAKSGGFKLVSVSQQTSCNACGSSRQGESSTHRSAESNEALALLSWSSGLTKMMHPFTLQFKGSGATGEMGDRWNLMVVVTALRLWYLNVQGRTGGTVTKIEAKMRAD